MRLRPVALPVEHGGWGFLLEPLVVGLGVAPARSSLLLGVAACAAFLLRHPLRIVLSESLAEKGIAPARASARARPAIPG